MRQRIIRSCLLVALLSLLLPASVAGIAPTRTAWTTFAERFTTLAPQTGFLAAEVVDGRCQSIYEIASDQRLALGSTFKLYVLAELARQVEAGQAAWDEELPIRTELKSLPSGSLLYAPAGTRHTLQYYAERMIAESDNTATDHLIARLGRENVEAVQSILGHGAPELNTPFLMTREWFAFKIKLTAEEVDTYLASPDDEQRRILHEDVDRITLRENEWGDWFGPKRIDSIEWFASPAEICQAFATLHEMAGRPGLSPINRILTINRGGVPDVGTWPYAGFKEGYEAGVINKSWLLRRADGRVFVLTAGLNDPVHYIDQYTTWQLMTTAAAILGRTP